jgi:hypothetical protein
MRKLTIAFLAACGTALALPAAAQVAYQAAPATAAVVAPAPAVVVTPSAPALRVCRARRAADKRL